MLPTSCVLLDMSAQAPRGRSQVDRLQTWSEIFASGRRSRGSRVETISKLEDVWVGVEFVDSVETKVSRTRNPMKAFSVSAISENDVYFIIQSQFDFELSLALSDDANLGQMVEELF